MSGYSTISTAKRPQRKDSRLALKNAETALLKRDAQLAKLQSDDAVNRERGLDIDFGEASKGIKDDYENQQSLRVAQEVKEQRGGGTKDR